MVINISSVYVEVREYFMSATPVWSWLQDPSQTIYKYSRNIKYISKLWKIDDDYKDI